MEDPEDEMNNRMKTDPRRELTGKETPSHSMSRWERKADEYEIKSSPSSFTHGDIEQKNEFGFTFVSPVGVLAEKKRRARETQSKLGIVTRKQHRHRSKGSVGKQSRSNDTWNTEDNEGLDSLSNTRINNTPYNTNHNAPYSLERDQEYVREAKPR